MPLALPPKWSLETLTDYIWGVEAGLLADDALAPLAVPWTAHLVVILTARDARDGARQQAARAAAVQRFIDVQFDESVGLISGTAFLAADKRADAEPYVSLFGTVTAADAKEFGAHRASSFGADLIATARRLAVAALAPLVDTFAKINHRLHLAGETREKAERASQLHDLDRKQLLAATERLAAETEIALLRAFFGRPQAKALVSAILGVPKKQAAKAAAPTT